MPKRRYMLLLLAMVVSLSPTVFADDDEKKAIDAIEKMGGTVRKIAANVDWKEAAFHLSGTDLNDEGLAHVAKISNLVWLNLRGTKITDAGLAKLAGLEGLQKLHLEKTAVTDAGLKHLAKLQKLEYLNLYGTKVTNAGLDHIAALKGLKKVYLWQTAVNEEGAKMLAEKAPNLEVNLGAKLVAAKPPADEKKPAAGKSIKDVMKEAFKGGLLKKVIDGSATKEEKAKTLDLLVYLADSKAPKGDAAEWKKMTQAVFVSSAKVVAGRKTAVDSLKSAMNCKACHDKFK